MKTTFEKHLTVSQPGMTAIDCLQPETGFSRQQLKTIMQNGAVWLENNQRITRLRRAKRVLETGNVLHLYYDEAVQQCSVPDPVLIEDCSTYSIWDKPAGVFSQGSKWGDHCTIHRRVETRLMPQRPCFIVHRLDRAASGLMILAHSKRLAQAFSGLFRQRKITKHYRVTVHGAFQTTSSPSVIDTPVDGKVAKTCILEACYDKNDDTTCLLASIETGRKHQIRRHLAEAGHPVVGDRRYGGNDIRDLQLRCVHLAFECPNEHIVKRFHLDTDLDKTLHPATTS